MPLMARSFSTPGKARQLAWKTTMLARSGTVRMPTIYGVMTHEEHPGPDVLLLERMRGVSVEAPARTPERWEQLKIKSLKPYWLAPSGQSRLRRRGRQYSGKFLALMVPATC